MSAAGIGTFLVDTGIDGPERHGPDAPRPSWPDWPAATRTQVVRLERLAEQALQEGLHDVPGAVEDRLRTSGAIAAKSIAAYRVGLDLPDEKPDSGRRRRRPPRAHPHRVADRTVSGWLAHTALELGLPLQVHTGYGDPDLDLLAADPLHLTPFLRATQDLGVPVLLLHTYPFHRNAAYLSQVFDHVLHGPRPGRPQHRRSLDRPDPGVPRKLKPFGSRSPSTDAYGLAELYLLGALLFLRGFGQVVDRLVADGDLGRGRRRSPRCSGRALQRGPGLRPLSFAAVLEHPRVHGDRRRGAGVDRPRRAVLGDVQHDLARRAHLGRQAGTLLTEDEHAGRRQRIPLDRDRTGQVVDPDERYARGGGPGRQVGHGWMVDLVWYRSVTIAPRRFQRRRPTMWNAATLKALAVRMTEPMLKSWPQFSTATWSGCRWVSRSATMASCRQ